MSKLLDMFKQAQRAQAVGGMGFLGKNKSEHKPRAAAMIVEFTTFDVARAEATIKARADGLLFSWDSKDTTSLDSLKSELESARGSNENVVYGLRIIGDLDTLERQTLEQLKDAGVNYVVLPLQAPARLLTTNIKDFDIVVNVPMQKGDFYPLFIRNLTAFDTITAAYLDFDLVNEVDNMSIEDVIQYRAVREAVRFPSLIDVPGDLSEADAYTIMTLGVQALVLPASDSDETTKQQLSSIRGVLEKMYQEEKENSTSGTGKM